MIFIYHALEITQQLLANCTPCEFFQRRKIVKMIISLSHVRFVTEISSISQPNACVSTVSIAYNCLTS